MELIEAVPQNEIIRKTVHRMKIAVLHHLLLHEAVIRVEVVKVHVLHPAEEQHARVVEVAEAVEEDKFGNYLGGILNDRKYVKEKYHNGWRFVLGVGCRCTECLRC